MADRIQNDWVHGRASLGAAGGWTAEEMRLVADLGHALAEQGRHREAITIFDGLAALAPATAYFQSALGALWLRMNEPQRALQHLDAALEADSQDLLSLINRGEAHLQLNETRAAMMDLSAAVRLGAELETGRSSVLVARARALLARLQSEGSPALFQSEG
jgi:predicted Zn-dependent protease